MVQNTQQQYFGSGTLRAKNTEAPRKKGGSPIALEECASGVRWQGASCELQQLQIHLDRYVYQ